MPFSLSTAQAEKLRAGLRRGQAPSSGCTPRASFAMEAQTEGVSEVAGMVLSPVSASGGIVLEGTGESSRQGTALCRPCLPSRTMTPGCSHASRATAKRCRREAGVRTPQRLFRGAPLPSSLRALPGRPDAHLQRRKRRDHGRKRSGGHSRLQHGKEDYPAAIGVRCCGCRQRREPRPGRLFHLRHETRRNAAAARSLTPAGMDQFLRHRNTRCTGPLPRTTCPPSQLMAVVTGSCVRRNSERRQMLVLLWHMKM